MTPECERFPHIFPRSRANGCECFFCSGKMYLFSLGEVTVASNAFLATWSLVQQPIVRVFTDAMASICVTSQDALFALPEYLTQFGLNCLVQINNNNIFVASIHSDVASSAFCQVNSNFRGKKLRFNFECFLTL